jgi:5-methylthioadenosine/S-adenosylhomocysteine deaminase
VSETHGQVEQSLTRTGFTPVEVLHRLGAFAVPVIVAHAAHATPGDIQILAREGAGVIHCPKTFLRLASGIAPLVAMKEAGVRLGFGSDGAASNSTLDILDQARLAAMLQKLQTGDATVFTVADTLQMATLGAAHAIHYMDGLGDLAPGMLADLILIRQDGAHMHPTSNLLANVLYSAHAGDIDTTIVNGRVLMHNRQLLTLNKGKIFQEVATRMARLHTRIPSKRIQTWQT